ncbi:zinc-dependent peptidase [Mangrovimonas sp. YM274]|uniref:zinc-dependent peptidase n=1 Tax=Mangrovimonas sp. YM274 TaxID=3070660 RepID=UPI0027DE83CE|nr:zinc-dependent peptidase [Mangrovimonas sp. YM274]WMI68470.1 zinc-dependent peptidase [Mangrovimonas sp. YM274]
MKLNYKLITILEGVDSNILGVFLVGLLFMLIYFVWRMVEFRYVIAYKRPLYVHVPFLLKSLNKSQRAILRNKFTFYKKLYPKQQRFFEHRVASFIADKDFIGRGGVKVSEEMKVLISATAVMLTFGFRDFYIGLIDKIFIYPEAFYSNMNESYHKGEFNPKLQALVLSWKDFEAGYEIENDNLNLGIHEFAHAIHLNSYKEKDVSATIFADSFKELIDLLAKDEGLRKALIESEYFRNYAYTNQFEFIAVIIETFIETPKEFQSLFPEIYDKTKQMLNFHFAGY